MTGEMLYTLGLLLMGISAVGGVIFAAIEAVRGKKLRKTLDREYGKKPKR